MIIAIHQPNFFPWLGYFKKIVSADTFVFLDNVQVPKKGGSWVNRVKIRMNDESKWITCPILRPPGFQLISHVNINENMNWRRKLWKTIEQSYKKSSHWDKEHSWVYDLVMNHESNIGEYNIHAIEVICEKLRIQGRFTRSSEGLFSFAKGTELLINIVKSLGGDTYLSGDGADGYQEGELYGNAGICLKKLNFRHPTYDQGRKEFLSGLSVLDGIFNVGSLGLGEILRG